MSEFVKEKGVGLAYGESQSTSVQSNQHRILIMITSIPITTSISSPYLNLDMCGHLLVCCAQRCTSVREMRHTQSRLYTCMLRLEYSTYAKVPAPSNIRHDQKSHVVSNHINSGGHHSLSSGSNARKDLRCPLTAPGY